VPSGQKYPLTSTLSIIERLSSNGYATEISSLRTSHHNSKSLRILKLREAFDRHSFVAASRPVSDASQSYLIHSAQFAHRTSGWMSSKQIMFDWMDSIREELRGVRATSHTRRCFERLSALIRDHPVGRTRKVDYVLLANLYDDSGIRALIDACPDGNAMGIARRGGLAALSAFFASERRVRDEQLAALAALLPPRAQDTSRTDAAERVRLATALFSCKLCPGAGPFSARQALAHHCKAGRLDSDNMLAHALRGGVLPWNHDAQLYHDPHCAELAVVLLRALGLDPDTTTSDDMKKEKLRCKKCKDRAPMSLQAVVRRSR
jgi:hypothetical protein